jgi:ABC-type transporter Mla subunit MlaD
MMAEQQQQRVNQAAEQFANVIRESYQALAERGTSAQELNAQLTQEFFNRVIENLRTQAEDTRQLGQQLADQQQRATQAGRTLTQESVSAYTDFVNSMFSAAQVGGQAAQRGAQRTGGGR